MIQASIHAANAVALKEWAVAIAALLEGRQIMLLRKGGIAEETRDFELLHPFFYFMPTYEHQKKELLKPAYRQALEETMTGWNSGLPTVTLQACGEATDDIEIRDQETLDRLRDYHIWTDEFAEERLKWKRRSPLHLLLVRVYRLEGPAVVPMRPGYIGCKSWVRLEDRVETGTFKPVLDDSEYYFEVDKIKRMLAR